MNPARPAPAGGHPGHPCQCSGDERRRHHGPRGTRIKVGLEQRGCRRTRAPLSRVPPSLAEAIPPATTLPAGNNHIAGIVPGGFSRKTRGSRAKISPTAVQQAPDWCIRDRPASLYRSGSSPSTAPPPTIGSDSSPPHGSSCAPRCRSIRRAANASCTGVNASLSPVNASLRPEIASRSPEIASRSLANASLSAANHSLKREIASLSTANASHSPVNRSLSLANDVRSGEVASRSAAHRPSSGAGKQCGPQRPPVLVAARSPGTTA